MNTKDQTMTTTPQPITFRSVFTPMKAPRWLAALSLLLATAMPALGQCPLSFVSAGNYAAGDGPTSVALGDFNADGRPDLAVANSSNVSVLLSNANGTFQARVNYAVGSGPGSVAVGDFNADGRPDLAVANAFSNNVSILRGNANGTFQVAVNYAVGRFPVFVAVGDFNADGRPDLAVANRPSANVSILLGNANGTFQAAVNYGVGTGASFPFSVAVGDFNADGRPDLAVANISSNNVSVLLNTIGFSPPAITHQPASQIVAAGHNAAIAITADGLGNTLTYQWRKNGAPIANGGNISGATSPTLSFTPTLLSDIASYDVQVIGAAACNVGAQVTTSAAGILAVTGGGGGTGPCAGLQPSITQQPASRIRLSGSAAVFTVAATSPAGGGALTYQWRRNGVNLSNGGSISGATNATLIINAAALSDNGSAFDCIVSNTCGSTRTNPAGLAVSTIFCLADVASDGLDTIYNPNGSVGPEDLDAFIAAFIAGC